MHKDTWYKYNIIQGDKNEQSIPQKGFKFSSKVTPIMSLFWSPPLSISTPKISSTYALQGVM